MPAAALLHLTAGGYAAAAHGSYVHQRDHHMNDTGSSDIAVLIACLAIAAAVCATALALP